MTTLGGLLQIGRSSLVTHQAAIGIVSGNTANADTPGFARREVSMQSLPGAGVGEDLVAQLEAAADRAAAQGVGAAAAGHARARGYRLGDGAKDFFRSNAGKAAGLLDGADGFDLRLQLTLKNSRKLIDAMIRERRAAYAGDPATLRSKVIG